MPRKRAHIIRRRLATLYAFVGWNAFVYVMYKILKPTWPKSDEGSAYLPLIGKESNSTVYEYRNLELQQAWNTSDPNTVYKAENNEINWDHSINESKEQSKENTKEL